MYKYCITISYIGSLFYGSQKQRHVPTVYGDLERELSRFFSCNIDLIPACRTDRGVHAIQATAHFMIPFKLDDPSVVYQLNKVWMGRGLSILSCHCVDGDFHALSDATSRKYSYYFSTDTLPHYLTISVTQLFDSIRWVPSQRELRKVFGGNRNFTRLCNISGDKKTYIRRIDFVDLVQFDYTTLMGDMISMYRFDIRGIGFLYKMVRHVVGILLRCMIHSYNINKLYDYLMIHRPLSYTLAPVQGLHLAEVNYNNVKVNL